MADTMRSNGAGKYPTQNVARETTLLSVAPLLLLAALCAATASAQDYPNRPVRYIIPYATAGATDILGRIVAQRLSERFGQQVIIDNRPGATAIVGTEILAHAAPDGYTMMTVNISHGANPYLHKKLPYDTVNDFVPVTLMAVLPQLLVINPSVAARSVSALIALAMAKPGQLNYSSSGTGSSNHLAMELFKVSTRTNIVHVPYKGGGPTMQAVLAGEVNVTFIALVPVMPQIKAGKLIPLAISGVKRSALLPDVPTVAESGVPGFEIYDWQGVIVPKGTPHRVIDRLHKEILAVLALPDVKEKISGLGADVVGSTPEQLGEYIRKELAVWERVIREAGIRPD